MAAVERWCVRPYCTTCGSTEFRRALGELGGPLGGPLTDALCALQPPDVMWFPDWPDALEVALRDLPLGVEVVLGTWLGRVGQVVRFDDVVLYRIVRHLRENSDLRTRWVETLVPVATKLNDFSLIESLILTLRGHASSYPSLVAAATALAEGSNQVGRVLRNSGLRSPA